jgi:eukaryotic-like serine/threonine-protein kinase
VTTNVRLATPFPTSAANSIARLKGDKVDSRSDIFALGVVLYEMLAGQPPFRRGTRIETASAILADIPPDLSAVNGNVPPALERVVRHCLEKDPTQRFQSARDVAFALEGTMSSSGPAAALVPATSTRRFQGKWLAYGSLIAIALAGAALVGAKYRRAEEGVPPAARFEIPAPAGGSLQGTLGISSVISPDGSKLVMVVTTASGQRLFVRPLAATAAHPLDGTEGAVGPFWSPDSRWIAFFSGGKLRRIPAAGGTPQPICDLEWGSIFSTGSWGPDDTILMANVGVDRSSNRRAIYRVRPLEVSQSPCCNLGQKTVVSRGHPSFRTAGISSSTRRRLERPPKSEWRRLILRKQRG